jgi:hypothetical protein
MPERAEMDAVLEQAMVVQRQRRTAGIGSRSGGNCFDRVIVGDQDGEAARRNPI